VKRLLPHTGSRATRRVSGERALWRCLATCVLSSRVPYDTALAAASRLHTAGFPWGSELPPRDQLRERVERLLTPALLLPRGAVRYRFPTARAAWLADAVIGVYATHGALTTMLRSTADPWELRRQLVASVPGVGPKQASMFLRDAGIADHLAVIDSHVAKFMVIVFQRRVAPCNLGRLAGYETHEAYLAAHAREWHVTMRQLDRAIWATMRAAMEMRLV